MSRVVSCLVLALAGCGRFGFDGRETPADAMPDAAPTCQTLADDTPCDDRNVCSLTSVCSAGSCVAKPAAPATCVLADSTTGYDNAQGVKGWFYGYWDRDADADQIYDPSEFREMAYLALGWRSPGWEDMPSPQFNWAYTMAWGGHPSSFPRFDPIRRWKSDVSGPARVMVGHRKSDASGGDGTRATLVVDGVIRWTHDVEGTDAVGVTELVDIELAVGSTVDFVLDPIGDDGRDTTEHEMTITSR